MSTATPFVLALRERFKAAAKPRVSLLEHLRYHRLERWLRTGTLDDIQDWVIA